MVKLFRWLLGFVRFSFSKGFIEDFIDLCYDEKINIQSLKVQNSVLYGECLARDYIRLRPLAKSCSGKIRVVKKCGIIFPLLKLRNRWGLFAGAIAFVCIISFSSGFIWNIEIVGNEKISQGEISSFLEQNNLKRGASWKSVNKDEIESLMMASFDDVAWVHINENGTSARVEINEAVPKPEIKASESAANIKAKKDGLIVKTSVLKGWACKKAGDSVTKGDLLISGIYENENKKGTQFAHASGEFIAQVKEPFSLTIARKQSFKDYKEQRVFKKLCFFGLKLPLYFIPYETKNSELNIKSDYLKLNGRELPIGIITLEEKRFTVKTRMLSDSELQSLCEQETKRKLKEDFSEYEIIKKNLKGSLCAEEASIRGEIICLEDIGEEIEIKIKNK